MFKTFLAPPIHFLTTPIFFTRQLGRGFPSKTTPLSSFQDGSFLDTGGARGVET
jgi:hypothetical protein